MNIEERKIQKIISLHDEVRGYLKLSLEKAIRIGELLAEQKESLKHGEFTPWVKANLPFTDRTARNYMGLYRKRDLYKTETVSDLTGAYKLLSPPKDREKEILKAATKIRERQRQERESKLEQQRQEIEHAKAHPEKCPQVGKTTIAPGGAGGWKCKYTVEGELNGLPMIHCKCIDPEYKELEANETPYEITSLFGRAICELESATHNLKNIKKKAGGISEDMYKLSWNDGITILYSDLEKTWKGLKKVMDSIKKPVPPNTVKLPEELICKVNGKNKGCSIRDGWTVWGLEAG